MTDFSHRSRIDIIACIIENSSVGSKKTKLISKCNLNLSQFNKYADFLVGTGLLRESEEEDRTQLFEPTEKGEEFLSDFQQIRRILREDHSSLTAQSKIHE